MNIASNTLYIHITSNYKRIQYVCTYIIVQCARKNDDVLLFASCLNEGKKIKEKKPRDVHCSERRTPTDERKIPKSHLSVSSYTLYINISALVYVHTE